MSTMRLTATISLTSVARASEDTASHPRIKQEPSHAEGYFIQ